MTPSDIELMGLVAAAGRARVVAALHELPMREAIPISLHLAGISHSEIGRLPGHTYLTVQSLIRRALVHLHGHLSGPVIAPPETLPAQANASEVIEVDIHDGGSAASPVSGLPAKANEVIEVGSADWHKLTERRAELIHKKNRQGLTEPELAEYEQLQQLSREAINRTFPRPKLSPDELAAIKQALDSAGE